MKARSVKWVRGLFMILLVALTFGAPGVMSVHGGGTILYAKPIASGTGDCLSWANACTLQTALTASGVGNEIWVMAGTHRPIMGTNRSATFQLQSGVPVYGGFVGTETVLKQRNPATNVTILSGDIDNNDSQTPIITDPATVTGNSTNSYHVITGVAGATLDGFTVTAGKADGITPNNRGGGLFNISGSSPTLMNVTFSGNTANYGGGMHNYQSNPTLTNVIFRNNLADYSTGGGMGNYNGNPILTNVTFAGNQASTDGGGMYNDSSGPSLTNVTFSNNRAGNAGGGMGNNASSPSLMNVTFSSNSVTLVGGGIYNHSGSPILTNVTFNGNSAVYGGGIGNEDGSSPTLTNVTFSRNLASFGGGISNTSNSNPTLTNVTFSGNTTTSHGGGIWNYNNCNLQIRDTLFWGNTADNAGAQIFNYPGSTSVVKDSVMQDGCQPGSTCTNVIATDPLLSTLGNYGGFTQTIPLLPGSSAINTGNGTTCAATDQRGKSRVGVCDIGAYEYDYAGIYYVKPAASGAGNCQNWANACTLQTALTTAVSGDELWVVAGTYKPTTGTDRTATFQLKGSVAVYGGFAGTETARSQRNPAANLTVLSGEIGAAGTGDNSYHIVTGATGALLDGFTITAGKADGAAPNDRGGGMLNQSGGSPTLANVTFSDNTAAYGGGMYNDSSSPTLTNVTFSNNLADYSTGGGMGNDNSNPTLTNVTFRGNSASTEGGGMYNNSNSNPTLTNVTFQGNSAQAGGGMANASSNPTLTNVTFSGNVANGGGGMGNWSSSPTLTNVTFSGNSASIEGGGMGNGGSSSPQIRNTIFWGNLAPTGAQIDNYISSPVVSDSVIQGGYAGGTNIITADPLLGALGNYGGFTQTVPLQAGSSAINTGNDAICPAADQRGVARPQGMHCDIGAYEFTPFSDILLMNGGAWNRYDFSTGGYLGGVWTGTAAGCLPALIDYDGDGMKEYSQLCGGAWHFYNKDGSYNKGIWVGGSGNPVPGDYNGDGKDEPVVFSAGGWNFFNFATGAYEAANSKWTGTAPGCVPAPLDYNGDGKMKFSLFCGGPWHFYNSDGSYNKGIWIGGSTSNTPAPADYDGNGTEEVVLFASGTWHFYDFVTGTYNAAKSTYTGLPDASAKPAPIDYNQDGSLDFVEYANGTWYFYNPNGSLNKFIATGSPASAVPMTRRFLP